MSYYLLYDPDDKHFPYCILSSNGSFTTWQHSIIHALLATFNDNSDNVEAYLANPTFPIIATYDQLPTIESHPELFI